MNVMAGLASRVTLVLLGLVALPQPGCASQTRANAAGDLLPSRSPLVADIPVPQGCVLVDRSSEDWSSGPLRYVRHRYRVRASAAAVRLFFRKEMPLSRWAPVDERCIAGRCTMNFERPATAERSAEQCTVSIEGAKSWIGFRTMVEVLVAPKLAAQAVR